MQQGMRPPGYAYPGGAMPKQPRPHLSMGQGNMGLPQGPMSPVMSGVANMQAPQVCFWPLLSYLRSVQPLSVWLHILRFIDTQQIS